MVSFDGDALRPLDGRGYTVLEAITHEPGSEQQTHARPNKFICINGKTYWVKGRAQQGLVSELIAGRLASRAGAGPMAQIIRVTPEILPSGGEGSHLEGVVVGLEDQTGTVNARHLQNFIAERKFEAGVIDPASRALVIVFQSWIGVGDAQVLVHLSKGAVFSIDHGDAFAEGVTSKLSKPAPVIVAIPGATEDVGKDPLQIDEAVKRIESITDSILLKAVAGIPLGGQWKSPVNRRLEICQWLAHRRDQLREVMLTWVTT